MVTCVMIIVLEIFVPYASVCFTTCIASTL